MTSSKAQERFGLQAPASWLRVPGPGLKPEARSPTPAAASPAWHGLCYCTDRHAGSTLFDSSLLVLLVALTGVAVAVKRATSRFPASNSTASSRSTRGALRDVLQTKKGSWIPWGRKRYFDRRAFEADLKRIEAFYRDRGFPDARVTLLRRQAERRPRTRSTSRSTSPRASRFASPRSSCRGSTCCPNASNGRCVESLPLQPEQPLDRQLELASRERALNAAARRRLPLRRRSS